MSYSTRKRRIVADDGMIVVAIDITVGVREHRLTRDEHNALTESAASQVMQIVPGLRFLDVPLSKVKVTR
jgi:hypothetical protein